MLDEKKRRNEIFELINNAIIFYNAFLDVSILHICVSSCIRNVSVQFSHSVVSDALWSHGPQHTRPLCPSPTPRVYPNSCPLSQGCHPTISSSVLFPSPPAYNLSQHHGLFKWVSSSHQVVKILEWVAYPFSSGSSWTKNWAGASCIACGFFTKWIISIWFFQ